MVSQNGDWWTKLTRNGSKLPDSVAERARWYGTAVNRERFLFYVLDIIIIAISAFVPISVALGASASSAAILGAALTGLIALRQMLQPQQNWIRNAATLVAIQGDIVAWSYRAAPYDKDTADQVLATNVESRVSDETIQWTDLRKKIQEPGDTQVQ